MSKNQSENVAKEVSLTEKEVEEILAFVGIAYRALKSIEKLSGTKFRELSPEEKAK